MLLAVYDSAQPHEDAMLCEELSERRRRDFTDFCRLNELYLFMDGARLGSALTSPVNDLTLADIASLTDVFYLVHRFFFFEIGIDFIAMAGLKFFS